MGIAIKYHTELDSYDGLEEKGQQRMYFLTFFLNKESLSIKGVNDIVCVDAWSKSHPLSCYVFSYRGSVLILTFFAYTTYHLSRKPISVVKVRNKKLTIILIHICISQRSQRNCY